MTALAGSSGGCSGSASEERVRLRTKVAVHGSPTFDNALGWHVELDGAWLSIGSLRLLEGAPLGLRTPRSRSLLDLLVKTAHAHPGHYHEGAVLAEMLSPQSVDLLETTELDGAEAVTGAPLSGQLVLTSPAIGAHAELLDEAVVRLEGVARPTDPDVDDEPRRFVATASVAELGGSMGIVEITGCPYDGGPIRAAGTMLLGVDVALWLDQVDFTGIAPEASAVSLSTDARAHNGFLRGLAKAAAYRFDLQSDP